MKSLIMVTLLLAAVFFSESSNASTEGVMNVRITGISTHDSGTATKIFLVLSDGSVAYIQEGNKEQYSLAMSAFLAGKTVTVWRYIAGVMGSAETNFWLGGTLGSGSPPAYRIHRIDVVD